MIMFVFINMYKEITLFASHLNDAAIGELHGSMITLAMRGKGRFQDAKEIMDEEEQKTRFKETVNEHKEKINKPQNSK